MGDRKKRQVSLCLIMVAAVIFWMIGSGLSRDLSASVEETYKGLKIFSDVIALVEKNYVDPVDTKKLIEKAIQGMVHSLDPHSTLLLPDDFEELRVDTKGKFTGIGISITLRDGFVTVVSPIEGTPAYKAGIKAGDRIYKVDGKQTRDLREAVKMMRGPKGTRVVVTVLREGAPKPIDFNLIRDVIPIKSIKSGLLKPGYGYVWITHFRDDTTHDLISALEKLEENGPLKGLVLDLRDNPGGLLPQAIRVSDLFLEEGKILSIEGRLKKHTKIYKAYVNKNERDCPIVVLINGGSASASEIVAGALQDNKRGLILGTTSFGKGSVQTVETLRDGYGLKLTIARYFSPSGRSIQAKGIEPDIVVKHSILSDKEADEQGKRYLKEKDLKNHLEAKPDKNKKSTEEGKKDKKSESEKAKDSEPLNQINRHGPLDLERLLSDNQVVRALEILTGYNILQSKK